MLNTSSAQHEARHPSGRQAVVDALATINRLRLFGGEDPTLVVFVAVPRLAVPAPAVVKSSVSPRLRATTQWKREKHTQRTKSRQGPAHRCRWPR